MAALVVERAQSADAQFYHCHHRRHVAVPRVRLATGQLGHAAAQHWFRGCNLVKDYVEPGGGGERLHCDSRKSHRTWFSAAASATGLGHGRLIAWISKLAEAQHHVWPESVRYGGWSGFAEVRFQWTFPVEVSPHDGSTL